MTDHQRDTPALPHQTPQLPDLSALAFGGGADLDAHFRRLDEISRRRSEREVSPLVLPDFVTLAAEDSLDLGEDGGDLLEDARANIARGEYALALEQLAEFLEISPGHPEARYLQAYCHYRLGDLMPALEITLPMRREKLDDPQVRQGVLDLRGTVLDVLTPEETRIFFDTRRRDPQAADDRLRRFIEIAPEETEPPYLLALMQAMDGNYVAAFRTAHNAVEQADGDVEHLRALADALALLAVRPLAKDAVHALSDGAYRRARRALARLDRPWREMEILRDLDKFLTDLIRTGRSPAKPLPEPNVPADRRMRLYALIADRYRQEALDLVADRRWADAERVLTKIVHLVPKYPPPNFLYAVCLLYQGKEPERAIAAAEIAATDPALLEAALLLQSARQLREVLKINAAYEEHNAAVHKVDRPPTRQQLIVLRHTMDQLRHRMPKLEAVATTGESQKRVRDLKNAVTRQLREVDRALSIIDSNYVIGRYHNLSDADRFGYRPGALRLPLGARFDTDPVEVAGIRKQTQRLLDSTTDPQTRKVLQQILDSLE